MDPHAPLIAQVNQRFYARCAELQIIPPVGQAPPPTVPPSVQHAHDRAITEAQGSFAAGMINTEEYEEALAAAAAALYAGIERATCRTSR